MARVQGGAVRPHVQAFADAVAKATGVTHISTYPGHQPTIDRALDIFCTPAQGDAVAEYAAAHWQHYGVDYWIWRQRIRNPPDRNYWRAMADRGSATANHYDHVHVSFATAGAATPAGDDTPPAPPPKPPEPIKPKEAELLLYQVDGRDIYLVIGNRKPIHVQDIEVAKQLEAQGHKVVRTDGRLHDALNA